MYCMLLFRLGWRVSGYHLNRYITDAQLRLAKIGHALFCIFALASQPTPRPPSFLFRTIVLATASTTLAKT